MQTGRRGNSDAGWLEMGGLTTGCDDLWMVVRCRYLKKSGTMSLYVMYHPVPPSAPLNACGVGKVATTDAWLSGTVSAGAS